MFLALGIATTIYIAVALGVFGTLTVEKVIASGGTALAVAAEPVLGRAGFWMMTVTALFSTAGATNAGLFPAAGICEEMANTTQFPPLLGRRFSGKAPAGLLLTAAIAIVLAVGYDLNAIASVGSAIALVAFGLVTAGHFRVRRDTGASVVMLGIAILTTAVVFLTFVFTTLVNEPATMTAIVVMLALAVLLDITWKHRRDARPVHGGATPAEYA
jgi:amino acid transporter